MAYDRLTPPSGGSAIEYERAFRVAAPDRPVIPFIEGDGIGPDIWAAARRVFDTAVEVAYGGQRQVVVRDLCGREGGLEVRSGILPAGRHADGDPGLARGDQGSADDAGGRRDPVAERDAPAELDLYCCIRPVAGTRGPLRRSRPGKVDIVVFRENTEDVYAGIEWKVGTPEQSRCGDSSTRRWERTFRRLRHRRQADERAQHETARRGLDPVCPRQEGDRSPSSTRATS